MSGCQIKLLFFLKFRLKLTKETEIYEFSSEKNFFEPGLSQAGVPYN
jgi:hypothetical protein